MRNQWIKDFLLICSVVLFGTLSLFLFLKNVLADWLLQTNWILSPQSVLSIQNIRSIEPNQTFSFLRIHSRINTPNQPIFAKDLEEFPISIAFDNSSPIRDTIPLDDTVEKPNKVDVKVYFVRLNGDGLMLLSSRNRTIHYNDTPIIETLNALMSGPTIEELSSNYLSLIPPEARILSLSVSNGLAILDMNEAFTYNTLGSEGLVNQIKQIVYTLTGFASVNQVQFLIEGGVMDFLGNEGLFIGKPIGRRDL